MAALFLLWVRSPVVSAEVHLRRRASAVEAKEARLPSSATSETFLGWTLTLTVPRRDHGSSAVEMRAEGEDLLPPLALPW